MLKTVIVGKLLQVQRFNILIRRTMAKGEKRKTDSEKDASPTKKAKVEESKEQESKDSKSFAELVAEKRLKTAKSVLDFKFQKKRVRMISEQEEFPEEMDGVLYWMSRDQRVQDNWAFLYAQRLALKLEVPLHVCFSLVPKFLEATIRHYNFMLKGLEEVEQECQKLDIGFHLLIGQAKDTVPQFVESNNIGAVVTDFSPLRVPTKWKDDVKEALPETVPFCQVDAHNIVPCWEASPKLEYGARTIRNKINNQLGTYLTEFPPVTKHKYKIKSKIPSVDWIAAEKSLKVNREVKEVKWAKPGTAAGIAMLESFVKERLRRFNDDRNNPNMKVLSNLSPWYHFGQLSTQRAMLMVRPYKSKYKESVEGYLEEGIVRRELGDNFCYYNKHYDEVKGTNDWAKKTLKDHAGDKREYLYSREKLEKAKTHDQLWNAAQKQMVTEGKMHGFLRMYWAKKILEWTESPETALADAIYLNDKYSLDGRDPNGYVGCMWSICGIHDQGWREREVFGKIRYMNYAGCKRKFDVAKFEAKYKSVIL